MSPVRLPMHSLSSDDLLVGGILLLLSMVSRFCRLLAETGDSVELVEASDMVPGLKFRRGVSNWIVSDKLGNLYKNFSEVPEKVHSLLRPSMFPPPKEESAKYNLVRNKKTWMGNVWVE